MIESGVIYGVTALIIALVMVIFTWWRANSAPAPGMPLGSYKVTLKYAGQKMHHEVEGILVDCTAYFCAPEIVDAFKSLLTRDISKTLDKPEKSEKKPEKTKEKKLAPALSDPKSEQLDMLQTLKNQLNSLSLESICRIVVTRDGALFGEKHLFVQLGDSKKSLSEYASHEEESRFSLQFGPVSKGKIDCVSYTLPDRYAFKNSRFKLGTVTVHIIKPDANTTDSKITQSEISLAKIVLSIPHALDVEEHLKSLGQQIKDLKFANEEMGKELSAVSTERDFLLRSTQGFTTEGGKPLQPPPKKNDVVDYIVLFALPSVAYAIADAAGAYPLIGVIAGLSVAGLVVYKRH
jgi:hypothetical protein